MRVESVYDGLEGVSSNDVSVWFDAVADSLTKAGFNVTNVHDPVIIVKIDKRKNRQVLHDTVCGIISKCVDTQLPWVLFFEVLLNEDKIYVQKRKK